MPGGFASRGRRYLSEGSIVAEASARGGSRCNCQEGHRPSQADHGWETLRLPVLSVTT